MSVNVTQDGQVSDVMKILMNAKTHHAKMVLSVRTCRDRIAATVHLVTKETTAKMPTAALNSA
jgi:hypothetical protein